MERVYCVECQAMNDQKHEFIEKMGIAFERNGSAPMLGRVWGALLISDKGEMTAEELASQLRASRGAISHATRQLSAMRCTEKFRKAGDRKDYFRIVSHGLVQVSRQRVAEIRQMQNLLHEGMAIVNAGSTTSLRLIEEHMAFTQAMEIALNGFLDEWQQHKGDERAKRNSNA